MNKILKVFTNDMKKVLKKIIKIKVTSNNSWSLLFRKVTLVPFF